MGSIAVRVRLALACAGAMAAVACSAGDAPSKAPLNGDGNYGGDPSQPGLKPPRNPDQVDNDAGALGVGRRGADGGISNDGGARAGDAAPIQDASQTPTDSAPPADATTPPDAGPAPDSGSPDAGPALCPAPLGAGDLAIVELMISSRTGPGDRGEWLEVQSTRACALNLNGMHAESPRTSGPPDTLDVTSDVIVPPNGLVVIANSLSPSLNNDLPPVVLGWAGAPADVLQNGGDSVTLSIGGVTIDALAYPAFTLFPGTSISFPANCAWSDRASWTRWSYSNHFWTGALQGTPNADNTDVTCF